ncbi:hypothetical protein J0B03_08455 [Alkalibacter rhizosphaerae]|uniref:Uncharacterized protein n=1 Tax=Alkalibacter rhizosphaerae TaxID=2815577 RepID=A0A975AHU1_9FIRM|nr:hypothetical protein [Alkalibacter rhizosphaerae]QSX07840.1 hypothetical protein J0B03_08455 [Alkalibacter rhizosphaerae]
MVTEAFKRLFWGFLLVLLDFRISGWDILPDVIGYLFFVSALKVLAEQSDFFRRSINLNMAMIFLSIVYLYEQPNNQGGVSYAQHPLGGFGAFLGFIGFFVSLLLIYRIFMGIKEMSEQNGYVDLAQEAQKRWKQYLFLQFAVILALLLILVPPLALLYILAIIVFNVVYVFVVLGFLRRCREAFASLD